MQTRGKKNLTIRHLPAKDGLFELIPASQWLNYRINEYRCSSNKNTKQNCFLVAPVESANKAFQALIRFILIDCCRWISWNETFFDHRRAAVPWCRLGKSIKKKENNCTTPVHIYFACIFSSKKGRLVPNMLPRRKFTHLQRTSRNCWFCCAFTSTLRQEHFGRTVLLSTCCVLTIGGCFYSRSK